MGWLFTQGQTRAEVIDRVTEDWVEESGLRHTCLAKCTRGNVVWSVWAHEVEGGETRTVIHCDLIRPQLRYGWGYKGMSEGMGPAYYTCPLAYLKMATDGINEDWRERVRQYHAKTNQKLQIGDKVTLTGTTLEWVIITSVRPLQGVGNNGRLYRIPRNMLGDKVA